MKTPAWKWVLALALLIAAGLALRAWPIATRPLWFDEASDWLACAKSAGKEYKQFFLWTNDFEAAPFTFFLRRLSMDVLGTEAEWAFRLPSLICSALCIPMAFWLGRAVYSNALGLLVAALVTFDPNMVDQGQQGRSYPMFMLLILAAVAWSMALFRNYRRSPHGLGRTILSWAGLGVILGLLFSTTQFGLAVWFGLFLAAAFLLTIGYFKTAPPPVDVGQAANQPRGSYRGLIFGMATSYIVAAAISAIGLWHLYTRDAGRGWGARMTLPAIGREIVVSATDLIQATPKWLVFHLHLGHGDVAIPAPFALLFYPLAAAGLWLLFTRCRASAAVLAGVTLGTFVMLFPFRKTHHFMAPRYLTPIEPALWIGLAMLTIAPAQRRHRIMGAIAVAVFLGASIFHSVNLNTWFTGPDAGKWLVGPQIVKLRAFKPPDDAVVYQPQVLAQVGRRYDLHADPALDYAFYDVPRTPDASGHFTWQDRAKIAVPDTFHAPATWLVVGMVSDTARLAKAQLVVEALAHHYRAHVDPGERDAHLQEHRAVIARFRPGKIDWQSVGVGEPDRIEIRP